MSTRVPIAVASPSLEPSLEEGVSCERNRVLPSARLALWDVSAPPRHQMAALLTEAAARLRPEAWGQNVVPVVPEPGFQEARERTLQMLAHAPFHTAPSASWRGLVDLSISYSAHTFRPERGVACQAAEALVAWFSCLWKLDDLVDAERDALPASYLARLRQDLARAWWGDEDAAPGMSPQDEDRLAFPFQAAELLRLHRRQLRALGQPLERHPHYQRMVWDHIISQTGDVVRVDSLGAYFGVRRVRGGMGCVFPLYLALRGVAWSDSYERIVDVANVVTCLTDDLFSAPRDAREGVVGAVALCGPARVLRAVSDLHRELLSRLERLVAADDSPTTCLFVRTVLDVVLGMLDWQCLNPRYREGAVWLAAQLAG
jgi:hypothetical protein